MVTAPCPIQEMREKQVVGSLLKAGEACWRPEGPGRLVDGIIGAMTSDLIISIPSYTIPNPRAWSWLAEEIQDWCEIFDGIEAPQEGTLEETLGTLELVGRGVGTHWEAEKGVSGDLGESAIDSNLP